MGANSLPRGRREGTSQTEQLPSVPGVDFLAGYWRTTSVRAGRRSFRTCSSAGVANFRAWGVPRGEGVTLKAQAS
jgi:hypothetical protein